MQNPAPFRFTFAEYTKWKLKGTLRNSILPTNSMLYKEK